MIHQMWDAEASKALVDVARQVPQKLKADIETMSPNTAVGHVIEMLTAANKYMEERAPWKMAKDDLAGAAETLYNSVETLRIAAILLTPVMPVKMNELLKRIGWTSKADFKDALSWGLLKSGTSITKGEPLFPRVENKA
jgi:methionyl-tRNA synthetase